MERDGKNDGGLVSREEEKEGEEVGEEGSKAGDEMRQRLRAGIKPAIVRASARGEEGIFKELHHDVMGSRAAPLSYICVCTEVCGTHSSIHLNTLPSERGHGDRRLERESGHLRAERKGLPPHFSSARPCLDSSCSSLPTPSPSLPMTAFFCYLSPRRASLLRLLLLPPLSSSHSSSSSTKIKSRSSESTLP